MPKATKVGPTKQEIAGVPEPGVDVYKRIACLILGHETPPVWLVEHLRRWAASIFLDRHVQAKHPSRSQIRINLLEISIAARFLSAAINDPIAMGFFGPEPIGRIQPIGLVADTLTELAARAECVRMSAALATKDGTTKSGQGRAYPANALTPAAYCALVIAEAWQKFHGKYPSGGNSKALSAVDAYWRACGGIKPGWGDQTPPRWRKALEGVNSPIGDKIRAELRRQMVESEHAAQLLVQ